MRFQLGFMRGESSELDGVQGLGCFLLRRAVQRLMRNNTCASDSVVAEMLQELDDDLLQELAHLFRGRLLNCEPCLTDSVWDADLLTPLRKSGFKNRVRDYRPITILPVRYKLYSWCSFCEI